MSGRIYYDPRNPRMLTRDELSQLTPTECAAASEQLDQNLVATLQEIDATFVRASRIVSEKVIPNVQRYGESSKEVWQSVTFWKRFYETAAGIRLSDYGIAHPSMSGDVGDETDEADATVHAASASKSIVDTTAVPTFASGPSNLDRLHEEMKSQLGLDDSMTSEESPKHLWTSSEIDGEILPPVLETISLGDIIHPKVDKSKGKELALVSPVRRGSSSDRHKKSAMASTSTPARHRPMEVASPDWNGLVDLSKTPLSAFRPPPKDNLPPTIEKLSEPSMSVEAPSMFDYGSHRQKPLAKTPAKEAVKKLTRDAWETVAFSGGRSIDDSPIMDPPSVLKNWDTRGYGRGALESPTPSGSSKLIDDEGEAQLYNLEDSALDLEPGADFSFAPLQGEVGDEIWGNVLDEDVDETLEIQPDVDTVFGGRRSMAADAGLRSKSGGPFHLRGLQGDMMDTLHGGNLLEAEPFIGSPLAGRDVKRGL